MNKITFKLLTATSLLALAACGGSSTGSNGFEANGAGSGEISTKQAKNAVLFITDIADAVDDDEDALVPDVDPTGEATFFGFVYLPEVSDTDGDDFEGVATAGNLTLDIDFDGGTVAADASDFSTFEFEGDSADDATVTRSDTQFVNSGTLSGTGTIDDDLSFVSSLDGTLDTVEGVATIDTDMSGAVGEFEA